MNKEEIKQLIKDNLKIEISSDYKYKACARGCDLQVTLLWGEQKEVISTSEEFLYF